MIFGLTWWKILLMAFFGMWVLTLLPRKCPGCAKKRRGCLAVCAEVKGAWR